MKRTIDGQSEGQDLDPWIRRLAERLLAANGNAEEMLDLLELSVYVVLAGEQPRDLVDLVVRGLPK